MIEKYEFGMLRVGGKEHHHDVIIYSEYSEKSRGSERVDPNWCRKEGHRLDTSDLEAVMKVRPEVLIVGTGYYGRMEVPKETIDSLKGLGIDLYIELTKEACQKYNELKDTRKVAVALHLTC